MKNIFLLITTLISFFTYAQLPELRVPVGHAEEVNNARYSPDGKYIITVSNDKTAKIWNAIDGKFLRELKHPDGVTSAMYSPDGKNIVTSCVDGIGRIWNPADGKLLFELKGHSDWMAYAAYSPDGKKIVTASWDNTAIIWDATDGSRLLTLKGHTSYVFTAVFSPDGKSILTASRDGSAALWNVSDGQMTKSFLGHTSTVICANFSPDGKKIITASADKTARIWSLSSGKMTDELKGHTQAVFSAVFSPDGRKAVTASVDKTAIVWDAIQGEKLLVLVGHQENIFSANFSPDGKTIVTGSGDYSAAIWNTEDGTRIMELKGQGRVYSAVYSPDGKSILTASADKTAKIWSAEDGKLLVELKGHKRDVGCANFSPDGKMVITASGDGTAKIWNVADGKLIEELDPEKGAVESAEFSADGKFIVTSTFDYSAQIWKVSNMRMIFVLKGHTEGVYSAHFSPDGKKVVTASGDKTIKIWNAADGTLLKTLEGHTSSVMSAEFSPDGKTIVSASWDNTARIWDLEDGELIRKLKGHTDRVLSASYSPDGKTIITASMDGSVRIWNASDGKLISELRTVVGGLLSANFSPDGKRIVCTSNDNTIKIWDVKTNSLIYSFFSFDGIEYIVQLPNGFYTCTPNAARKLYYVKELQIIAFDQLDVKYNRPDKILAAIGNTDTALIMAYHQAWIKRIKKLGVDTAAFNEGFSIPESGFKGELAYEQKTQKIKLHIWGNDSEYKLDHFQVWVNESPVWGQKGISLRKKKISSYDTIIEVTLADGINRIETSVMNVNGIESFRSPVNVNYIPEKATVGKTYFIGIGIDHFKDSRNNLTWSSKDIRDMSVAFKNKLGDNVIIDTLFNQNVTIEKVRALKTKLKLTNVNDKVIICYSGHGLLSENYDYYLSTYNVNFSKPEDGGLAYEELENLLDGIPARQKLMMIDACHSGEVDKEEITKFKNIKVDSNSHIVAGGKGPIPIEGSNVGRVGMQNSFELMQTIFVNVNKGTGATIISAAGGAQYAYEKDDLKNGVFTYCILEMMKTEKECSVQNLKSTVSTEVELLTKGMQKPTSRTETSGVDWNVW